MALRTTPFGFASTAREVADGLDLRGRRIVVTGGASGIGVETARALAGAGAEVTIAVRDLAAGERVAAGLPGRVRAARLDLADRASIAAFVAAWDGPLHALVNNAGVMAPPEEATPEGLDPQLAVNHLGHFALTTGLYPALAAEGGRVVVVSSNAHFLSPVVFEDPHFRLRRYEGWQLLAYAQSKTANVLFAEGLARRGAADGIVANALMPGAIPTALQRHVGGTLRSAPESWKTAEQGAATSVLLAASPLVAGVTGGYFMDGQQQAVVTERPADFSGVAAFAVDPGLADRLWAFSEAWLARG